MPKRRPVSKKLRFEVFKRDNFKCQYCGASAPDVILEVDHINPVAKGGKNDILNLVTSCRDCNAGKGARLLGENTELAKQRAQLEELNERREQIQMILQWRAGLEQLCDEHLSLAARHFLDVVGAPLPEEAFTEVKKHIKKYGVIKVIDAIYLSAEKHLQVDEYGLPSRESVEQIHNRIGSFAKYLSLPESERQLRYCRGIVRNRMYCNDAWCLELLRRAYDAGVPIDDLLETAKTAKNWSRWQDDMLELIEAYRQ